ncbi:MAG: nucleotidyl transferase AbiEii/AbiGii toxin family protein [Chloroflexia bacterium]
MNVPEDLAPLLGPLLALERLLARFGHRGVVIGGVAAALLGRPRLTADVDALLLLDMAELPRLLTAAAEEGLQPRIADAEAFARRNRVLLLRHQESAISVDISLGALPLEEEIVARSQVHRIGPLTVRLPTPEDLIILKAVAHRPQDLLDIQALIEAHPDLDRQRIRRWIQEFAQALEMPGLWTDIAPWLEVD